MGEVEYSNFRRKLLGSTLRGPTGSCPARAQLGSEYEVAAAQKRFSYELIR